MLHDTTTPGNFPHEGPPTPADLDAAAAEGILANVTRWLAFRSLAPGEYVELQALEVPDGPRYRTSRFAHVATADDAARLLTEADRWKAPGLYQIANHVDHAVATRAAPGRWHVAEKGSSTSDREVPGRRVLFVDLDARRPKGTSATDEQVLATHAVAVELYHHLAAIGASGSLAMGHSGNGRSVFLALDDLPEGLETSALVKGILAAIKELHETADVEIDLSVSDAKRLIPAWGTVKRKGAEGVPDRPHRRTAFLGPANPRRLTQGDLETVLAHLIAEIEQGGDVEGPARVTKAMGLRGGVVPPARPTPRPAAAPHAPPPPRGPDLFSLANDAIPIADVLDWLGLTAGGDPVCPGCGLHGDSSVAIVGNGVKCLHARCAHLGHPGRPGFRGVVDVVAEARSTDAKGALAALRVRWPSVFPSAPTAPPRPRHAPAPAPAAPTDDATPGPFQRGDHVELSAALLADLGPAPLTHDDGQFWRYDAASGAWAQLLTAAVEQRVTAFAGRPVCVGAPGGRTKPLMINASTIKGVAAVATTNLLSAPDRRTFGEVARGVAFRNGFAVVRDGAVQLLPHAPEHMARAAFPFDYDPLARYDALSDFFESVFADCSEEARGAREALIQQFIGACLVGAATHYERCLVLFGLGGNGKGAMLKIARGLFPPGTVVSLPPQQWGVRFQVARLVGALGNFCDEIPERDITAGDTFKAVISGNEIHAERKNKDPFEFRPSAGCIFNANGLPGTVDQSEGFWRRFLVVPFMRRFDESPEKQIDIGAAVLASCLPGCVAWALEGAAAAQRQGGYTIPEDCRAVVAQWREESDPVRLFLRERAEDRAPIAASAFYDAFSAWARSNGHASMSSTRFGRRVMSTGIYSRRDTEHGREYRRIPTGPAAGPTSV